MQRAVGDAVMDSIGLGMVLGCAQAFHGFPERNKNLAHGGLYAQFSSKKSFEGGNEKYFGCAGLF